MDSTGFARVAGLPLQGRRAGPALELPRHQLLQVTANPVVKRTPLLALATLIAAVMGSELPAQDAAPFPPPKTEPRVVTPGRTSADPPSDAVVLFDGKSLASWRSSDGTAAKWQIRDGYMEVAAGTGDIITAEPFGDCQLHIEWATPSIVKGEGQERGNSGVFLMSHYEIQVLDSYRNETYADGQAGAVYGQTPPLVNASRPPGQWQTYDIIFHRPRFAGDGTVRDSARVTLLHNGELVQADTIITGWTVPAQ